MTVQVAGCIQLRFLYGECTINKWLQENGDLEIIDIKPLAIEDDEGVLIIYHNE